MLLLTATTDKIQLVTDAAVTVDVHASYMDYNGSTVTPGRTNTAISTAATTDIVASPASSTQRNIKTLHIRNRHASTPVTVTLVFDQNGTDYELYKVVLLAGSSLEYIEGIGFFTLASNLNTGTGGLTVVKLASDFTNSTTTPTNASGLNLTTGTGTFRFIYWLLYQSAATGTGIKVSVDHTGTVTAFVANIRFAGVTTTASAADAGQAVVAAAAGIHNSLSGRAKSQAGWGVTASVDAANSDMLMIVEGLCIVTVDGSLNLWAGSEVGASQILIKTGSALELVKLG